jgi:subtilisin
MRRLVMWLAVIITASMGVGTVAIPHEVALAKSGLGLATRAPYPTIDWRTRVAPFESFDPLIEKAGPSGTVRAIVGLQVLFKAEGILRPSQRIAQRARIATARKELLAVVEGIPHRVLRRYKTFPFMALELSSAALEALRDSGRVPEVREERIDHPSLSQSTPLVEATETTELGLTGSGSIIAILDTGVDAGHPFFGGRIAEEACISATASCPNGTRFQVGPGAAAPCTFAPVACQHGTKVAGIAAGSNGTFEGNTFSGVAPGAQILPMNLSSPTSSGCPSMEVPCPGFYESDELLAFEGLHLAVVDAGAPIAAINMSFAGGEFGDQTSCVNANLFSQIAIIALHADGVAAVAGAGNDGNKSAIGAPACLFFAVSVGSVDNFDRVDPTSNSASFLSLLAPGVGITTSVPRDSLCGGIPEDYCTGSGTSMATPHVAGAFAVLRQWAIKNGKPTDVSTLLAKLQASGQPVTDPMNNLTTPRLRLLGAATNISDTGFNTAYDKVWGGGRVKSEGVGLKGKTGAGSISISSVPPMSVVRRALLYWMTVGTADSSVIFEGNQVNGALVGASRSPCSSAANGGATRVYRANVTSLVPGAGTYDILNVGQSPGFAEGASIVLIMSTTGSLLKSHVIVRDGARTAKQQQQIEDVFYMMMIPPIEIGFGTLNVGMGDSAGASDGSVTFAGVSVSPPISSPGPTAHVGMTVRSR